MHSETHLVNVALSRIGQSTVNSLDDQTATARKAKIYYAPARDAVLAMHPWNCAAKRLSLAPLADAPVFEFSKAFGLPDDYIRIISIYDQDGPYRVEGRTLLTDQGSVEMVYVHRLTDVSQMDHLLKEAIAFRLAADLAGVLNNKDSVAMQMRQMMLDALAEARYRDSAEQQQPYDRIGASGWLSARRGNRIESFLRHPHW